MAIKLPTGLPARSVLLREGIELIDETLGNRRGERPLRIALLNLMPRKIATETQSARLLGATPHDVELTLVIPDSYKPRTTSNSHIAKFYSTWSQIRDRRFDGMIVTGAPVETLPFEEVRYWPEFTEILDWSQSHVSRSFHICWAAQAALQRFHGVPKDELADKLSGVFTHKVVAQGSPLLRGFGDCFPVPVSRRSEVRRADLPEGCGLEVLAEAADSGLCLIEDWPRRATYMFNHLEYDAGTLGEEFVRDRKAGLPAALPRNYFPDDDPGQQPIANWRAYGHLLFRNWLDAIAHEKRHKAVSEKTMPHVFLNPNLASEAGAALLQFEVIAESSANTVTEILSRLAMLEISPRSLKAHGRDRTNMLVELCLDRIGGSDGESIARELLKLAETRRVSYRDSKGTGGTFVPNAARRGNGTKVSTPLVDVA